MATHRSAEKAHRQSVNRRIHNREFRSRLKSELKSIRGVLGGGDVGAAEAALPRAVSFIDRMASKGIIHSNTASRYKARLAKSLAKISAG